VFIPPVRPERWRQRCGSDHWRFWFEPRDDVGERRRVAGVSQRRGLTLGSTTLPVRVAVAAAYRSALYVTCRAGCVVLPREHGTVLTVLLRRPTPAAGVYAFTVAALPHPLATRCARLAVLGRHHAGGTFAPRILRTTGLAAYTPTLPDASLRYAGRGRARRWAPAYLCPCALWRQFSPLAATAMRCAVWAGMQEDAFEQVACARVSVPHGRGIISDCFKGDGALLRNAAFDPRSRNGFFRRGA